MKKIAIVTATRAEYGLLTPLIRRVIEDNELELDLIVTGAHLSAKYGHTIDAIRGDGFPITCEIPILDEENTPYGISITMANAIKGFAACFRDDRPDMVVILGDRTEMLGVASAAMNERIPIAHIHGGEVTEGAVDDCVRHAITKMSYLHFTSTDTYRRRVIQLGEDPDRVFNVGALGAENILHEHLMSKEEIRKDLGIESSQLYAIVTFHPVTLENNTVKDEVCEMLRAMDSYPEIFFLITASNADVGGDIANKMLRDYCSMHGNCVFTHSLGMRRYLSAVKYASFVLGNSSSGILEAPVLGTPAVNIGDRQKGRLLADTVINCIPQYGDIIRAIDNALVMEHRASGMYGEGGTSKEMIRVIKRHLKNDKKTLMKEFYNFRCSNEDWEMGIEKSSVGE